MEYLDSPSVLPLFYMAPRYFFSYIDLPHPPPPLITRDLSILSINTHHLPFFQMLSTQRGALDRGRDRFENAVTDQKPGTRTGQF